MRGQLCSFTYSTLVISTETIKVHKGDLEWDILAERNMLDIQLYEYIVQLFYEQKDIINTYYVKSNLADTTP